MASDLIPVRLYLRPRHSMLLVRADLIMQYVIIHGTIKLATASARFVLSNSRFSSGIAREKVVLL